MDWLSRINGNNPTHADKMRMLRYYVGEKCVCGGTKKDTVGTACHVSKTEIFT